jgi:hypothetical protein
MAMREVMDDNGHVWMIYAIVPDAYDDRIGFAAGYSRGWLCFQSGTEKWRYLGIPDGWESLGDMELLELMNEAIRVPDNRSL